MSPFPPQIVRQNVSDQSLQAASSRPHLFTPPPLCIHSSSLLGQTRTPSVDKGGKRCWDIVCVGIKHHSSFSSLHWCSTGGLLTLAFFLPAWNPPPQDFLFVWDRKLGLQKMLSCFHFLCCTCLWAAGVCRKSGGGACLFLGSHAFKQPFPMKRQMLAHFRLLRSKLALSRGAVLVSTTFA